MARRRRTSQPDRTHTVLVSMLSNGFVSTKVDSKAVGSPPVARLKEFTP